MKDMRIQFWLVGLLALLVGCGDTGIPVYPVRGSVTYKGEPLVGAEVAFFGLDDALKTADAPFPKATTDDLGEFELTSRVPGDGAPAGRYAVTVVWRGEAVEDVDPEVQSSQRDRLRGRFADPQTTSLQVEVLPQSNDLQPFQVD